MTREIFRYFLCLFTGYLALISSANAQTDLTEKKVSVNFSDATIKEVLDELSVSYQISFSYSNDLIPLHETVSIVAEEQPLGEVLNQLFKNTDTRYKVIGSQIILEPGKRPSGRNGQAVFTIRGQIKEESTGETLPGATIRLRDSPGIGVSANSYGFYSLSLPQGKHILLVSYMGFVPQEITVDLREDLVKDISLQSSFMQLTEVEVTAANKSERLYSTNSGEHSISAEVIKAMPSFGGEADAFKSLQMLPGILSANEGTVNLSVRGGSFDQNLILLDEAPVYNPSHALGFFSVFNPDAIQRVDIYKGSIPAAYGGRLSSVVDIRMKEGNNKELKGSAGIGLVSSQASLEGPVKGGRGSFMLAGRYSYVGQAMNGIGFLGQLMGLYAFRNYSGGNEINFYDINAKGNLRLNERNHIFLSAYTGKDHFFYKDINVNSMMDWGNSTATLRLNHIHNKKLFSNTTLLFSRYHYAYILKDGANFYNWSSNLRESDIKTDFDYYPNPANHLRFGAGINFHHFMPGRVEPGAEDAPVKSVNLQKKQAVEPFVYLSNEQQLTDRLTLDYGLRYAPFLTMGPGTSYIYAKDLETVIDSVSHKQGEISQFYHALEPRLSASFRISSQSALKASFARTTQYLHLVSNSSVGYPTDVWLPSDRNIKPQRAEQLSMGYFRNFSENMFEASAEVYYKRMHNVVDYKDHADLFLNSQIETQMRTGRGWGYGAEFLLRKNKGLTTGWISYTWSKAEREIEGVNNGKTYFAPFDKRHNISLTLNHQLNKRLSISSNFIYATGKAATIPQGVYAWGSTVFAYYTERNAYRLPDYHRLDLSLTLQGKRNTERRWQSEWTFGLYNTYWRKNIFSLYIKQEDFRLSNMKVYKTYLFGTVPSVNYKVRF